MTTKTIAELRDHEELSSLGSRLAGNGAAMGAFLGDLAEALGRTDTDGAGLYMEASDVIAAILGLRAALADMRIRRDASREEADKIRANRDEWKTEASRLRKIFDDAGQGEHNVLALIDHYQEQWRATEDERDAALAEIQALVDYRVAEIDRAVEAEREACAKLCEKNAANTPDQGDCDLYNAHMADARDIRAREQKEQTV